MNNSRSEPTQARRIINNHFMTYLSDQAVKAKPASNSQSLLEQVGNKLLKLRFVVNHNIESAFSFSHAFVFRATFSFQLLFDRLKGSIALVITY